VAPLSNRLFSVTASTMTLNAPPESVPPNPGGFKAFTGPIGGVLFDLIDVVRAYDFVPGAGGGGGGGGGGCHKADGDGHIQGQQSGAARFHFDADAHCEGDGDAEGVDASDPGSNMDFHSTQFASVAFDDVAHTMTIVGMGLNNGVPVTFTAIAVDNGQTSLDAFSLTLSDGYTNTGNLLDGTITLF
jgi:hypothetical protein